MYEQIQANKPQGATHWQAGVYYRIKNGKKEIWDKNQWRPVVIIGMDKRTLISESLSMLCMTTLSD